MKTCPHCQQANADWATECGRCDKSLGAPQPTLKRAEWEQLVCDTVQAQVVEMREHVAAGTLSAEDHDCIGLMMQQHVAHLIMLSDAAWELFLRFAQESRRVQKLPHEPHPDEVT